LPGDTKFVQVIGGSVKMKTLSRVASSYDLPFGKQNPVEEAKASAFFVPPSAQVTIFMHTQG
jgi:predicted RNase H-like nuclease (RuvC/YqgF family)